MKRLVRSILASTDSSKLSKLYPEILREVKENESDLKSRISALKKQLPYWGHPTSVDTALSNVENYSVNQMADICDDIIYRETSPGDVIEVYSKDRYSSSTSMYIKLSVGYFLDENEVYNFFQNFSPVTNCKISTNQLYNEIMYKIRNGKLKNIKIKRFY